MNFIPICKGFWYSLLQNVYLNINPPPPHFSPLPTNSHSMLWDAHRVPPPWPIICVPMRAGVHWLMRSVSAFAAPLPPVVCFVCPDKKRCLWKGYLSAIAYLHIAAYSLLRPRVVTTDNDRRRLSRTQCIVVGDYAGSIGLKAHLFVYIVPPVNIVRMGGLE